MVILRTVPEERTGGQRDRKTGTAVILKHTQSSPALVPTSASEGNGPTPTDLSL